MSPKNNNKQVSAAVRILQQKRDASARATHLMVKNDPLITYESGILGQATGKKFFSVTFLERKTMSTKTSFKRIALVAASALAIAGFSAVPAANAAATSFTISNKAISGSLIKCAQSLTSNASATLLANGGVCFSDVLTPAGKGVWANGDSGFFGTILTNTVGAGGTGATLTAVSPAQAVVPLAFYTGTIATTTVASGIVANTITGMSVTAGASAAIMLNLNAVTGDTANVARMRIGGTIIGASDVTGVATDTKVMVPFTAPVVAGVYSVTVENSQASTYAATAATSTQTFTLTVLAASDLSTGLSTAYMTTPSAGGAAASSTTNAVVRSAAKAVNTGIAQIKVTLLKADGTADTQAHVVTSTITGVGFTAVDVTVDTPGTPTTRTEADNAGASVRYVHVNSDGTAGTGSVTVTVQNVNTLVTTTLGTWSYTSTGSVATIAIGTSNFKIGLAGGDSTGQANTTRDLAGEVTNAGALNDATTTPAFTVTTKDSAGNLASAAALPTIVSANTLVVASGTCALDGGASTTYSSGAGVGVYNCAFVSSASSKSGDKTTLTVRIVDPADATKYLTATYDVTIGGSVATEVLAFDKATYATGESAVISLTAKDSAGNPVADGSASPAVTFNKSVGGTYAASTYVAGTRANAANTLFAPGTTGDFIAFATSGNAAASALSATSAVEGDASASLALDAANAATDAANNAYDEAQNATQAASDALAAVTALAAQVKTLIASVKKLTKAVAKLK